MKYCFSRPLKWGYALLIDLQKSLFKPKANKDNK